MKSMLNDYYQNQNSLQSFTGTSMDKCPSNLTLNDHQAVETLNISSGVDSKASLEEIVRPSHEKTILGQ